MLKDDALLEDWCHVLTLSRVHAGESVVVLSSDGSRPENVAMAKRAVARLGARVMHMDVPATVGHGPHGADRTVNVGASPVAGHRLAVDCLKNADLVIDTFGLLHSPEQVEILASGTRMLMVVEPPEILSRNLPDADDKRRVMAADAVLRQGRVMRVTSPAGTDVSFPIGQFGTIPEYGFADDPGHWDHWPSGFNSTFPNEGGADGSVVIAPGDMLFPFKIYVQSPIECTVREGRIVDIQGGFEAVYLRRFIAAYEDPDAFAISHIGWGLQPKARWTAQMMLDKSGSLGMEARAFAGNFLLSTGPNAEAGGRNASRCHIDIPMAGCTVRVDDLVVVRDGQVQACPG